MIRLLIKAIGVALIAIGISTAGSEMMLVPILTMAGGLLIINYIAATEE